MIGSDVEVSGLAARRFKAVPASKTPVPAKNSAEPGERNVLSSALRLRDMTHAEPPWRDADARGESTVISHAALREFFLTRIGPE